MGHLGNHGLALPLCGMTRIDVAQFMAEQRGQFRLVFKVDQNAACNPHRSAGEGVCVHIVGVEHTVRIGHMRPVCCGIKALADIRQILIDRDILYRPEILRELLWGDLLVDLFFFVLAHSDQNRTSTHR